MWKSKILFLWGVCAYECLTFRRFGANLKKVDTHKHEEKESTSADTLQRDFQLRGCSLLRGNEEGRLEDGFGVAGLNGCRSIMCAISSDGTACYSGDVFDRDRKWTGRECAGGQSTVKDILRSVL